MSFPNTWFRHGEHTNIELRSRSSSQGLESLQILLKDPKIGIVAVALEASHNAIGGIETGKVVDMPIGIVANNSFPQPEDSIDAQTLLQCALNLRT